MSQASSSMWTSFLKSIASFNGDLSSLTAPPFILSPTSLVEYSQYWCQHPDLFLNATFIKEPQDGTPAELLRMIAVTRWFVSTLRSQYSSRNESMEYEKKPLNPFLGELFVGQWEGDHSNPDLGETVLLSEQVSHHPPITAYAVYNDKNKVVLQGYNQVKSSFAKITVSVKQYGHAILELGQLDEQYLISLPPLHLEGLLAASPFIELEGKSYIQSSNGYLCVLEYWGKGYFSGKKNSFKARIFRSSQDAENKENSLYTISGQWSGISYITGGDEKIAKESQNMVFYDASKTAIQHLKVKPIDEQHPLESRKAWHKVAEAINLGDFQRIHQEKSALEQQQRELRKIEEQKGINWERRWFQDIDYVKTDVSSCVFTKLAALAQLSTYNLPSGTLDSDKEAKKEELTSIHWKFVRERWDNEKEIVL
ncbi:oxysterol-binding protein KES1 Ecym_2413 [Eremothecium cymbalariae DBVPG|uniref:Oxysterol-binding protein n=1 Tax=Eremothecium cymbalariae (strain CBS 270.75 / DBVPG 7215 / KCTC 17166 / NRRL Y-17582) TaxID=931890 RepID=G8JP87_ERECY|nr:Hypothetical protein Ecym_2413 [Eremothecium cymbalariae DBVPG\